jgi:transposase
MRFAGIDIASEDHVVAVVDDEGTVVQKATSFAEDAAGYEKLVAVLGSATSCVVAMEATGHYWQNLFAALAARGFEVALINPIRTHRFAQEEMARTKTDAIDALGIARFAQQKRPPATSLPDEATQELRELVRLRDRVVQDLGDATRRLHRVVDLGFPEFTRYVKTLSSELATTILSTYPTAAAFPVVARPLAKLVYDEQHKVGAELAGKLVEAAKISVGRHHGDAYRVQVRYACEDIVVARRRIADLEREILVLLRSHEVGSLLTTIPGIGPQTAARLVAEIGDFNKYSGPEKLAAYVGAVPGIKHSGKRRPNGAMTSIGNVRLRSALWMPVLAATRHNPWLRAYYERLVANGKLKMVALVASMRKLLHAIFSVAKHRTPFVLRLAGVSS